MQIHPSVNVFDADKVLGASLAALDVEVKVLDVDLLIARCVEHPATSYV